ncbi:hypothetical protein VNO78_23683 [Psophocarpus tetragonolobus]|uniref:Uncharacterized protein n=1 Tax=Psophocarpus tetragonolobus TaxID=3891 RepID=A0AAN9S598_PSOTE
MQFTYEPDNSQRGDSSWTGLLVAPKIELRKKSRQYSISGPLSNAYRSALCKPTKYMQMHDDNNPNLSQQEDANVVNAKDDNPFCDESDHVVDVDSNNEVSHTIRGSYCSTMMGCPLMKLIVKMILRKLGYQFDQLVDSQRMTPNEDELNVKKKNKVGVFIDENNNKEDTEEVGISLDQSVDDQRMDPNKDELNVKGSKPFHLANVKEDDDV